jgi:hypothetical protein
VGLLVFVALILIFATGFIFLHRNLHVLL